MSEETNQGSDEHVDYTMSDEQVGKIEAALIQRRKSKEKDLHIDETNPDEKTDPTTEKPDSTELDTMRKEIKELKKSLEEHEKARGQIREVLVVDMNSGIKE